MSRRRFWAPTLGAVARRRCIFCRDADGPFHKEDVWPRWFSKLMEDELGITDYTARLPSGRFKSAGVRTVTRAPCQRRNNSWMSDIEADVIPWLRR